MRRRLLLVPLMLAISSAASAADTVLHIADTATVMVAPDEFAASLQAQALSPTAADAQARVNALMKNALDAAYAAGAVASGTGSHAVTVSTGQYGVWHVGPSLDQPERWQAAQTLNLSGVDNAAILALVERLQQSGIAVGSLGWRLSPAAERKAHQDATKQALAGLRGRIDEAAAVLGLRFEAFKNVRLDDAAPPPVFVRALTAPLAAGMAATPPNAVAEDVAVTARAEADALLRSE